MTESFIIQHLLLRGACLKIEHRTHHKTSEFSPFQTFPLTFQCRCLPFAIVSQFHMFYTTLQLHAWNGPDDLPLKELFVPCNPL